MFKLFTHSQIFKSLFKVLLLSVFLFTSTLSFAIDCSDHSSTLGDHQDNHAHTNVPKASAVSSDVDKHDEGCHTSEKVQRETFIQKNSPYKLLKIVHVITPDFLEKNTKEPYFWTEKKYFYYNDPSPYSSGNLIGIVVINC